MNWARGLKRLSAVLWGACAAYLIFIISALWEVWVDSPKFWIFSIGAFIAIYVLHRLTCWVINGFAPKN